MDKESQSGAKLSINLEAASLAAISRLAAEKNQPLEALVVSLIKSALAPLEKQPRSLEGAKAAGPVQHYGIPASHPAHWTVIDTWLSDEARPQAELAARPSFSDIQLRLRFAGTPAFELE